MCSLLLRSLRGLSVAVHVFFWGLNFGMRLDLARASEDSEVLSVRDGSEGAGEPDDLGCETQSSERESNHACSIAMAMLGDVVGESMFCSAWTMVCCCRVGDCLGLNDVSMGLPESSRGFQRPSMKYLW